MLRGINKQFIFRDEIDFMKMETILKKVGSDSCVHDAQQRPCAIYAYCFMNNHLHLLIEEIAEDISSVMKRIGIAYVGYFNKRHDRVGPLFQGRFKSEPVGDFNYFVSLLHYIHMNPVKAGLVRRPSEYKWSSWREYELPSSSAFSCVCSIGNRPGGLDWEQLRLIVLNPDEPVQVAIDLEPMTDNEARARLKRLLPPHVDVQALPTLQKKERKKMLLSALQAGIGVRQLARITGVGRMSIARINRKA